MQHEYFAASNSAEGFKNYYSEVFARADFVYIIKGGPGTGKSSFMKRYARRAEAEGRTVEYYYCSSDPSSLDGVLIFGDDRAVGILDGTAPHVSEPKFPGAREEIVNLGQCWNGEILRRQKNEIIALSERKGGEYKCAYTFLRSVGNLRAVSDGLIEPLLDREKMRSACLRLIKDLPKGKATLLPSVLDSVSMNGQIRLDSFERNAEKLYVISEFYGVGKMLLDELYKELKERDVRARVSFDPICPWHVDGIFLEEQRLSFVTGRGLREKYAQTCEDKEYKAADNEKNHCDGNKKALCENKKARGVENEEARVEHESSHGREVVHINSKRFIDSEGLRDVRSELRYTARLEKESLDGALHALKKAKIYHFLLEDIYGKAMDWKKFAELGIEI